tara:strand:- start:2536 stop:3378 length:843 start_codon:yes stop_codon:yes gene_type:complete
MSEVQESVESPPETVVAPAVDVTQSDPVVSESDWKDSIPVDIRDNPNFAKYTSMESFAKGHLNAVSMLGKTPELKVPDNSDERSDFWNKLGRPEAPEGYEFKKHEAPEGLQDYVDGRISSFRDMSHGIGLSSEQANAIHDWYMEGNSENASSIEEQRINAQKESFDTLKSEWGEAYDKHINFAKATLAEFGDESLVDYLEQTGLGNNASLLRAFSKIGQGMKGDAFLESSDTSESPAAIDGQVKEIMAKPEYWNADSPERPALVRKVADLMERMHPEKAA